MKTFTVAAAMLALIALPAHAQVGGKRHQGDAKKTEQKKPEVDEKAYKAALERIPEPKQKYDPWGVRSARRARQANEIRNRSRPLVSCRRRLRHGRWRRRAFVAGAEISATDQKSRRCGELGERDADMLVAAPDPTAAADELIGLDFKRE